MPDLVNLFQEKYANFVVFLKTLPVHREIENITTVNGTSLLNLPTNESAALFVPLIKWLYKPEQQDCRAMLVQIASFYYDWENVGKEKGLRLEDRIDQAQLAWVCKEIVQKMVSNFGDDKIQKGKDILIIYKWLDEQTLLLDKDNQPMVNMDLLKFVQYFDLFLDFIPAK